uniref:Caspase-1 isoform 2 n=1 Tax=Nilaparvata lugens TaxID=108931 RepID=A0A0K0LBP4_NILLU|nr:caspase-1 isoform 2 [Nilaparvata lugens]
MEADHSKREGIREDELDSLEANATYNMNHKARGSAIIFNHEHFLENLDQRKGTDVDAFKLRNSLERLGFSVVSYKDRKAEEIENIITEASEVDHSEYDCFVVAILSHGGNGYINAYDHPYKPDILWTKFSADNCKTLVGKPKLFFIQACQGSELDNGITLSVQTDSSSTNEFSFHEEDFLIANSSIPGFFSFRNEEKGSYFVGSLCSMLDKRGTDYDILTLMTMVNHHVAIYFESNSEEEMYHAKKQIPCIHSTLTRRLKFNIKTKRITTE